MNWRALDLRSFKVLGGSYAIYKLIQKRLGMEDKELSFVDLMNGTFREKLGDITFAAATDGNHGRGVAWSAAQMGFKSVIYVHKLTSQGRIQAIEQNGARVVVVDGNYDDAVRQVYQDAEAHGWEVVSDTSWEGYEDIPTWVMQGYTTMLSEVQEQLAAQGLSRPTHVFVQAGVGSLAAATIGFYTGLFGAEGVRTCVVEPTKAACLFRSAVGRGWAPTYGRGRPRYDHGRSCLRRAEPHRLADPQGHRGLLRHLPGLRGRHGDARRTACLSRAIRWSSRASRARSRWGRCAISWNMPAGRSSVTCWAWDRTPRCC